MIKTVLQGDFYTAVDPNTVAYHPQALIAIDQSGIIERILEVWDPDYQVTKEKVSADDKLIVVPQGQVILPGFVDLHLHAPQWPQAGLALDKPLASWLDDYTFPLEAKYQDLALPKRFIRTWCKISLPMGRPRFFSLGPFTIRLIWYWPKLV